MYDVTQRLLKSSRVQALFSESQNDGPPPYHPYAKWYGIHWIMTTLADIGYPPGDKKLLAWREHIYNWLLPKGKIRKSACIDGRVRQHASQEGNAIYYLLTLGLADERINQLVQGLLEWQWPDGGWNCDRRNRAHNSSFHESLIPLRALALYANLNGEKTARRAAKRAAEIFLKRKIFTRRCDGIVIHPEFVRLHYPCYWRYDVLFGLKVLAEAGFIKDKRCNEALDLLESRQLSDGGWPADKEYYHLSSIPKSGRELVDWGPVGKNQMNEFVTVDALYVLKTAGRPG